MWSTAALLASASASSSDDNEKDAGAPANSSQPPKLATPRAALFGHEEGVNAASWSPDGRYLVSASDDRTARIWDVESGQTLLTLGRARSATSAFNAHGIAVDAGDAAAAALEHDDGHTGFVFDAHFNPQGSLVVTASFDESVRFWDVRTGRPVALLAAHHEPIVSARFNHDGTLLVTASYDGLARLWDVATRQCLRTIVTEPSVPLTHAQFSPNSRYVLFGTLDSTLRLYDYASERCVKTYSGHVSRRFCSVAAFGRQHTSYSSSAPPLLLCGSEDGRVCVWNMQSAELVEELRSAGTAAPAGTPVIAVDHHPEKPIVVASVGNTLHAWEQVDGSDPTGELTTTPAAAAP